MKTTDLRPTLREFALQGLRARREPHPHRFIADSEEEFLAWMLRALVLAGPKGKLP